MKGSPDTATALYAKLTGASGLAALVSTRVYNLQAPAGAAFPYVVITLVAGDNLNIIEGDIHREAWRAAAWSSTSAKHSNQVAAQVYAALHQQTLSIAGGWTNHWMACRRKVQLVETVGQTQYWGTVWDVEVEVS
jgi:hypothetical protein